MREMLLHICCGVCASSVIERLRKEGFRPKGFFYNPNIHPEEEYFKRQEVAKKVAEILKFDLIIGSYDKDSWFTRVKGLKQEPEGGRRCSVCFKMRLEETQRKAEKLGIPKFSSTLTVSPHKDTKIINGIGKEIAPQEFLSFDFKKKLGFHLAMEFTKRYNLYRQNYCGCIYSLNADTRRLSRPANKSGAGSRTYNRNYCAGYADGRR